MDEFKPEDELKPDPSDRRTGRSRQSSERDNEPQINFDDVDLDADERRPSRSRNARNEREDEEYESEEELMDEQPVERRPRKRKSGSGKTGLPSVHHDGPWRSGAGLADCRHWFRAKSTFYQFYRADGVCREEHRPVW